MSLHHKYNPVSRIAAWLGVLFFIAFMVFFIWKIYVGPII